MLDFGGFPEYKRLRCCFWCCFENLIGNPVQIRDGPATVIVEGWPRKPLIPLGGIGKAVSSMKRESGDLPEAG
jgi:hypothetical protein